VFGDLLDTTTSSKRRASPARPAPTGRPEGRRRSTAAAPAAPAAERTSESSSAGAIEPETAPPALQAGRRAHGGARRTSQRDAAQHPTSSAEEIVDALFSGLGVPAPADAAQRAAQASIVGQMLRAAISGTLDLLAARTIAKREMGENATLLQKRENNPLKFSPDTDAALARLLAPTAHGFVAPVEAINDAFADLRAHEVGLLSGMRAALDEVLGRFDPAVLEPRLAPDALWDKLVPTNRRARLWEQYCQQYAEILREVEGDFDTLFGRAFLRAYRAQLAEFARRNRPGPRESD
jgi:type VI secretion system FHA domain protein